MSVVSLLEIQRAHQALEQGQFRHPGSRTTPQSEPRPVAWSWSPSGRVIPVVGSAHGVGATTVAVAIALAADDADRGTVRLVECCSAQSTGLDPVVSAELRGTPDRLIGRHDRVRLERVRSAVASIDTVPVPSPQPAAVTVLDLSGWDTAQVWCPGWIASTLATTPTIVLVTGATRAAGARTERAVTTVTAHGPRVLLARVGDSPPKRGRRRPPADPDTVPVPVVRSLLDGVDDGAGLPDQILDAGQALWDRLEDLDGPDRASRVMNAATLAAQSEGTPS